MDNQNDSKSNSFAGTIPTEWPGAFKVYPISKAAMQFNFTPIIKLILINVGLALIYILLTLIFRQLLARDLLQIVYDIVDTVFASTLVYAVVQSVKGKKITESEAISDVFNKAVNIILTSFLTAIIMIVSIFLFIIPVFFVFPRIYLALYYVIDQNMGPLDAVKASWDHTRGHVGKVYGLLGVGILILLPSITIIGIIATVYFGFLYYASSAVLYMYINQHKAVSA